MSNSSTPRVVRKHKPRKTYTRATYRKALGLLLDDFEQRCAYSLVHIQSMHPSSMHVDHFDPRLKRRCSYSNLFPAFGPCNMAKSDTWPSPDQEAAEIGFLNPCKVSDYGTQIFEDPCSHELVGTTPSARYHIEMLDLNHPSLVELRRERTLLNDLLSSPVIMKEVGKDAATLEIVQTFAQTLKTKIPFIPPPPEDVAA